MRQEFSIAGICERDIDLLLLEEFHSSEGFALWFTDMVVGRDLGRVVSACRSVTTANGESDLEVGFEDLAGRRNRVLIENKVGASLQPQQLERYQERARRYVNEDRCQECYLVIVAPSAYFGPATDALGFDGRATYESIVEWFEQAEANPGRLQFKHAMLRGAIEKGTIGYQRIEDASTSDFWRDYWAISRECAPQLEMRMPKGVPARSAFVYFHPVGLPNGVTLCHKMVAGCIDLQIGGLGNRANELNQAIRELLEEGMTIHRAGQSAAIRLAVPPLDLSERAVDQASAIRTALRGAERLFAWLIANRALLRTWIPSV